MDESERRTTTGPMRAEPTDAPIEGSGLLPPGQRFSSDTAWFRYAGMGLELAGTTLLLTALGYWIDAWRDAERPLATALGMLVGFSLGMTRFIIVALNSGVSQGATPPGRHMSEKH
ncbi:AtpZ/AtpI family protein [Novipirellula artificiosorum]|uniref:F0F1-ATPase subunit n=1 Tax=Novipirellula artificiosorum TaxID=2528016 RepID=A0A5C6D1C0_9BACT|nr:AtpZ/AtpI family protein [Novipirellula artificiosorum]TWU30963.1 hypothetical protein Poly41_64320 [Novipirellula artificiosorum]